MRFPLARPDRAFGQRAELTVDRIGTGRDTRNGADRFQDASLPDDRRIILESSGDHEEVRPVGQRGVQERFRVVKRGLEGDRAYAIESGGAGSFLDTAPYAGSERAALGVEDHDPMRAGAMADESRQVSKVVAGWAQHADDALGASLAGGVGRPAVIPEDLTVRRGDEGDGKRRCAPIRSEEKIHMLLGQQARRVGPGARYVACVVQGREAEWAVGPVPTERQASGRRDVLHPEPDPVVRVLTLSTQRTAYRYRDSGGDGFGRGHLPRAYVT